MGYYVSPAIVPSHLKGTDHPANNEAPLLATIVYGVTTITEVFSEDFLDLVVNGIRRIFLHSGINSNLDTDEIYDGLEIEPHVPGATSQRFTFTDSNYRVEVVFMTATINPTASLS